MKNERNYLDLIINVLNFGYKSDSRAGPTISLPGQQITVDLREGFPMLTTRKIFTKGIFGELAAFVRGAEDLATFESFGCNYWKDNAANWPPNFNRPESEWQVGQSYGSLWRNFDGVDQLRLVIESLKRDPSSRRHVITAWHPAAYACLPSCHIMFQFYARHGYLHCHVYMRSVDLCVGLPSDIVLYALLMHLVGKDVGLVPATLTFSFGDAHIYENHIAPFIDIQRQREITPPPTIKLAPEASTLTFTPDMITIEGYQSGESIKYAFNS